MTAHIDQPTETTIRADDLSGADAYRLLTGIVVPRPIAWVTSLDGNGRVNLAPFSAYTMVSNEPPMIGINVGLRNGRRKDTAHNIDVSGEYVVNVATWADRQAVHESGRVFPHGESEAEHLGLDLVESQSVAPPRLVSAPISMECVLSRRVVFGDAGAEFTVGRVVLFHIRSGLYDTGKIDTRMLDPVARVAGPTYSRVRDTEHLEAFATGPTNG